MDAQQVQAFTQEWLRGWNERDLEALLSHYTEDVEFQSLLVVRVLGETSGIVRGRASLREYFGKLLAAFPGSPELELLGVFRGVQSLVIQFQSKGRRAAEVMELNVEGKVRRALAHSEL
jgi:hypothetical protein